MKKYLLLIVSMLLLAACSTPKKYAYYFDYYDYNSGKAKADLKKIETQNTLTAPETSPLYLNKEGAVANVDRRIRNMEKVPTNVVPVTVEDKKALEKKYSAMSKAEKREFRKELKSVVKKIIKAKKAGESIDSIEETKVMDHNLKMALIFGIVAIVLSAFGGANSIFWILGTISAVIAIVFLILWIAEQ